ncbi:P-loop containing nucleoside triphosphate hydrolase protein [Diplogelasinospora grovesii]|uniref:P-loop containing nucleoside triphosphate hydrolase protein n=1 Tax=Diplogelasinospora grovesii TaxID=303347 RepID=A0AAN6NJE6_9PEZI|nr:P-loop containing nucleoside triphosphate hydrolase protein [Diplogelasinospora grovesii]
MREVSLGVLPQDLDWDGEDSDSQTEEYLEHHWLVPFGRNRDFVGRRSILEQLLRELTPGSNPDDCQRTAIVGLGGAGKTQIALEAVYRIREQDPECSVFWQAYLNIGRRLRVDGIDDDKADVKSLVKAALSRGRVGRWLLVVDNADTALLCGASDGGDSTVNASLAQYFPFSRKGSILFTTRSREVAVNLVQSEKNVIPIEEMSRAEALKLLKTYLKEDQMRDMESTTSLLDFLADLPLAIELASAYMARKRITTTRYLDYCRSSNMDIIKLLSKDFEDRSRYSTANHPVLTTWLISFEHISRQNPLAVQYLGFLCFLAEKEIPAPLLPLADNDLAADEAISTLKAYAFISQREQNDSFDTHRLIQFAMQNWLDRKGDKEEDVTRVIRRVAEIFPFPEHENRDQGRYNDAKQIQVDVLALQRRVLGKRHPDTIQNIANLATIYGAQWKYDEAERIQVDALALQREVLGERHPYTIRSMARLAKTYGAQGRYDEAETIQVDALALWRQVLGEEHPETLQSMEYLAETWHVQERRHEAVTMMEECLQQRRVVLGADHPDTQKSARALSAWKGHEGGPERRTERVKAPDYNYPF